MKFRPVGTDLFHSDGRTERRDEANSRFSQFCKSAYKLCQNIRYKLMWIYGLAKPVSVILTVLAKHHTRSLTL